MAGPARSGLLVLASLCALLAGGEVRGEDDVSARLAEEFVYDDGTAQVRVEIGRLDEEIVGATLEVPAGFRAEGPFGGMRRTTVVGGVRRTVTEVEFRVVPPRGAKGEYAIGPVRLEKRSGGILEVAVGTLEVGRRPERGVRFEVAAEPPGGPVMMPFVARYRVLYSGRPHEGGDFFGSTRNPLGLTALSIPLLERSDVKVEPGPAPAGGPAGNVRLGEMPLMIGRGVVEVDGAVYRTLELTFRVTPLATGEIDLSAEVGMSLVTGVEKQRDFFNRVIEVPVARELRARTGPATYRVEDLPARGRPAGFTGAVGSFTIEADPEPRQVNAFDPIEVTVTVRGRGVLDRLSLPRWSDMPEITREFELDADLDPGELVADAKVFKVVFRARSSEVARLPSLPLPYFNPWTRRYEVARSDPVPITVRDVKTIRPEDAVGAPAPAAAEAPSTREPIGRRPGIGANFETPDEGVASLEASPPLFTPGFVALLAVPPLLAGLLLLLARARSRTRDVPRGTPLSRALAGLRLGSPALSPARTAEIFATFFRERVELPEGEITTPEIERALQARSLPPDIVERVTAAHAALISARFAGGVPPADLGEILREADRCLG